MTDHETMEAAQASGVAARLVFVCPCGDWQQDVDNEAMHAMTPMQLNRLLADVGAQQALHFPECEPMRNWLRDAAPATYNSLVKRGSA
jgi:hypothetical protein